MLFHRKVNVTEERIEAINLRLIDLEKKRLRKVGEVELKKSDLATVLGQLAMKESPEKEEIHKHAKKALERMEESYQELLQQIEFLKKERIKMETEKLKAIVRESPEQAEAIAEEFNKLLDHGLEAVDVLKALFNQLKEHENRFNEVIKERQFALNHLGELEPLSIKTGLGKMAFVPSPHGFSVNLPDRFSGNFLENLIHYKSKTEDYEEFKKANPKFYENIEEDRKEESKGFSWIKILSQRFQD